MRTAKLTFALLLSAAVFCPAVWAENDESVALTVYNDNFGVVREQRFMELSPGISRLKFTDVAMRIDPTSVNFECVNTPPGMYTILEQNYEYDLMDSQTLLRRSIDKKVSIWVRGSGSDPGNEMTGILSSVNGRDIILRDPETNRIYVINGESVEHIALDSEFDDLVTRPTLVWLVQGPRGSRDNKSRQLCRVTYTTGAISWDADYSAVLNQKEDAIDLSGWVTIQNNSGGSYKNASIKLIAGDVRRVEQPKYKGYQEERMMMAMDSAAGRGGFEEKSFMEYHMYTLGRKSTINNNQVKQIELMEPAAGIPVEKLYVYEWQKMADKVQIKLEFENEKENNLGIPLPKGKVRVFKTDPADEMLEFVGEDLIDHTPVQDKVSLYIGNAFDVSAEHTLEDSQRSRNTLVETRKVEVINSKDEQVTVFVDQKFGNYVNWTVDKANFEHEKTDAQTVRFKVKVGAQTTETLEYTVTSRWFDGGPVRPMRSR